MRAVVGTVPFSDFPLTIGPATLKGDRLQVGDQLVPVNRGTPALVAAAAVAGEVLGTGAVTAFLVGDTGLGQGSRQLYAYLEDHLEQYDLASLTFHYLQPDVDWHSRVHFAVEALARRPLLIADAGYMYVAKMSGSAPDYDLFTPDAGELAFLADEAAPHPFYTRGFILHEENKVPDLIQRAYAHDNAARYLLVKGHTDCVADRSGILASVASPRVEAMEAMGGTGDTLTGLATALIGTGELTIPQASILAAGINRQAGAAADLTPASQVSQLIAHIPAAMETVLQDHG